MTPKPGIVTIHMVSSVDGFIEKEDRSVDWMDSSDRYEMGVTLSDEEVEAFVQSIDCYVMGSRTYELALELGWPYGEVPVVVLTHRELETDRSNVEFYSGDLTRLVDDRLRIQYRNIWMVGGAQVTREFLRLNLADELVMTIVPVILGGGTPYLDSIGSERELHLKKVTAFKNGMVELGYEVKKP